MSLRVLFKPWLRVAGDALNSAQVVVKRAPSPVHRIVGTFSRTLQALGLKSFAA